MEEFDIQITEILQTTVSIEAESNDEALEIAQDQYHDAEIVLDADNSNVDARFMKVNPYGTEDYPLPSVDERANLISAYLECPDDAGWYALVNQIEEWHYGS